MTDVVAVVVLFVDVPVIYVSPFHLLSVKMDPVDVVVVDYWQKDEIDVVAVVDWYCCWWMKHE